MKLLRTAALHPFMGLFMVAGICGCQAAPPRIATASGRNENATEAPSPEAPSVSVRVERNLPSGEASAKPVVPAAEKWWDVPYPKRFDTSVLDRTMSRVSVSGNKFVDESGKTVVFQGVSIADPDKLVQQGHWSPRIFEEIARWGANIVRIPVHPIAWRRVGQDDYLTLLDQAVEWANHEGLYLIVDFHSIGNLKQELFQHEMYDTSLQEARAFWRAVSYRYQGVPTIALYELFNEPTVYDGKLGTASWDEWKAINEELISLVSAQDKQAIPLVAGFNWAYDLSPIAKAPVARPGIGYVSHPYPMKTTRPFEKKWEETWGFAADKYPLVATEIGYALPDSPGAHNPVIDNGTYGPEITDYLAKKGASWVAWCFDPEWGPMLIKDWDFTPTESGEYFRKVMLERKAKTAEAR